MRSFCRSRNSSDDLPPVAVSNLTRDGKKVRFTVVRGDHRADYSGVVADADTINGTVTVKEKDDGESDEFVWKATRQTQPKLPPQPAPSKPEE